MQINCPFCGERDVREFSYIGDALRESPTLDDGFEVWAAYVWDRTNPRGRHLEHWQHAYGCRQFLKVDRDTVTHEIHTVEMVGSAARGGGS